MAAGLGSEEADSKIERLGLHDKVTSVNSPNSVMISGDVDGGRHSKAHLDGEGVVFQLLKTDGTAYHSHHMAAIGQEYKDILVSAADAAALDGPEEIDKTSHAGPSRLPRAYEQSIRWVSTVTQS